MHAEKRSALLRQFGDHIFQVSDIGNSKTSNRSNSPSAAQIAVVTTNLRSQNFFQYSFFDLF